MSPELERALIEKYPELFVNYGAPSSRSGMEFGFECGDGWFDLLEALCSQLVALGPVEIDGEVQPLRAEQVKEKFGSLRFYLNRGTRETSALTALAGAISAKICELCGNKGRLRGARRLKTLCDPCAANSGFVDEPAR